ncbi:MAG: OmpA family protein [Nitrospirota bacterium]
MKATMHTAILFFTVLLAIFVGNVYAENRQGAVTLSPHIGGYIFEDDQDINSNPVFGLGVGYNLTERLSLEGVFDWVDTDSSSSDKKPYVKTSLYRIDGLYHFNLEGNEDIVPYLSIGAGAININLNPGDSDTDMIAGYGGGIKYFITKSLAARGEIRHIIDVEDDINNNLIYTIGLTYLIGGKEKETAPQPAPAPIETAAPAPMDSDGDGVIDDLDKCPGTPAGVKVDNVGCPLDSDRDGVYDYLDKCPGTPAGVKVDSVGCPLDSDRDGVYDYLDKCPGTPAGVKVDSEGCPLDSDKDGVYDYLDKCPGTPMGAPVDSSGCPMDSDGDGVPDYLDKCPDTPKGINVDANGCPVPIKEKVTIELNVEFDTNSAVVKNIYHERIQKVADFLKAYPATIAEIEGHTDSVGSDKYNLKLSQKRAESVMKHLAERGIDPSRMNAVGYGETRPVADNSTKDGRDRNRRVVAVISTVVTK